MNKLVKVKRTIVELVWMKELDNGELEYHDHIDELEVIEEEIID